MTHQQVCQGSVVSVGHCKDPELDQAYESRVHSFAFPAQPFERGREVERTVGQQPFGGISSGSTAVAHALTAESMVTAPGKRVLIAEFIVAQLEPENLAINRVPNEQIKNNRP